MSNKIPMTKYQNPNYFINPKSKFQMTNQAQNPKSKTKFKISFLIFELWI